MTYDKQTWSDGVSGGTAISGTRLQHIEDGIEAAHELAEAASSAEHTHTSAEITDATSANTVNTIVERDATGFIAVSGITGLSTATGNTQAVPKSQLDAAIAEVASGSHTHVLTDITDVSAVGAQVAAATDAADARDILAAVGVSDVTAVVQSELAGIETQIAAAEAFATSEALDAADSLRTDMRTSWGFLQPMLYDYTLDVWPVRPDTTSELVLPVWIGPAADPVPTTGTAAGGTAAAAPGDLTLYH